MLAKIPKQDWPRTDDFELHILCQKDDFWMLYWSLRSFIHHSGLYPKIIIHVDNNFDPKSAEIIESKFPGLKFLLKSEADRLIDQFPGLTEKVKNFRRNGHVIFMEFLDLFLLSNSNISMVMDCDLLFYGKPKEIVDFVQGKSPYDSLIERHDGALDLMVDDFYSKKYNLIEREAQFMNPGLVIYKKDKIKLESLLEYFDHTNRPVKDYFMGVAAWGSLISQTKYSFLPIETYHIKGPIQSGTVMKHFTSPRRYELYAYGIDKVRSSMIK